METTALEKKPLIEGLTNGPINLEWPERYISIAAGVKMSLSGLKNIFSSPFSSILKVGAGGYLITRGISGHCEIYTRLGKVDTEPVNTNIRSSFTIDKPRQEVYEFWRQLDNLPKFMKHLESVEVIDSKRSHWVLKLPADIKAISWDAEIVNDEPGEAIGWSSLPGSIINNAGKVRFRDAEDGSGTVVDVVISYTPPAGGVGTGLSHIVNPLFKNMVDEDVRNFKQYMEIDVADHANAGHTNSAVL
jgi:uncharacterized membrane protein